VKLDFEKCGGLLPVITQDSKTKDVLMLAYMNEEALEKTIKTGYAHYFSRSKNRLWKKGEESGHLQKIVDIIKDCDSDTILLIVEQTGVACHTGSKSCFFESVLTEQRVMEPEIDMSAKYSAIDSLYNTILDKKFANPEESYTAKLYKKGFNTIGKKIVEEAAELSFALKDGNKDEIVYEAADLVYHALVGLGAYNIAPEQVKTELARRFGISGIDEKNSRKD